MDLGRTNLPFLKHNFFYQIVNTPDSEDKVKRCFEDLSSTLDIVQYNDFKTLRFMNQSHMNVKLKVIAQF